MKTAGATVATNSFVPDRKLTWAVKLDPQTVDSSYMDIAADIVANDTKLFNLGQIGALHGYYHMMYIADLDRIAESETLKPYDVVWQNDSKITEIGSLIEQRLHQHVFVEWHSMQRVVNRSKRFIPPSVSNSDDSRLREKRDSQVHFNDPLFVKQWHLVSELLMFNSYF